MQPPQYAVASLTLFPHHGGDDAHHILELGAVSNGFAVVAVEL